MVSIKERLYHTLMVVAENIYKVTEPDFEEWNYISSDQVPLWSWKLCILFLFLLMMVCAWKKLLFLSPNMIHCSLDFWYQWISFWQRMWLYSFWSCFSRRTWWRESTLSRYWLLDTFQSSFNTSFPLKNITKDLLIENNRMIPNHV